MEIQQHDGVVVDAAGFQQGFAKRYWRRNPQQEGVVGDGGDTAAGLRRTTARGRGVAGEREAPRVKGAAAPPSPPLYRLPKGGAGPRRWDLQGVGRRPRGWLAPQAKWRRPLP